MADKIKVLLVDDDPDYVESIKVLLEQKGHYDVVVGYDGNQCIEKVKSENPTIIVLDVMMPNKDGYTACAELKSDKKYRDIPIILLTSVASHVTETSYTPRMGMDTEAEDYIEKPAEPNVIIDRIENLLKRN